MPPCPSPAGSVSPGMRQGVESSAECEVLEGGLTSMPSDVFVKLRALEEELLLARRDTGDFDARMNRTSEQLDRLWQDLAIERRERQVEINEERMLRVAEMAELRERIDKLSKVAHLEPEGNYLNDPPVLETYIEESQEDQNGAPELTADGQGSKLVFDAKHAEAQLRRLVADAKRAEAMVRREVGRAIADARAYLEDTGHQQQEFWAARQRMAAFSRNAGDATASSNIAECLSLRLEAEQLRNRMEATEHGFESVQKCVENLQSLPLQMEAYVNQEIDQVRLELKESLEERRKRRLSDVEHSVVKQAIAEVRLEAVSTIQRETKILREEFARSRSDEAYRQSLRLHEVEERISVIEKGSVSTSSGDEAMYSGRAVEGLKDGMGDFATALTTLRSENSQVKMEVLTEMQKMKQEMDSAARRAADTSAANLADLGQRFSHVEEKLRHFDAQAGSGDAKANLHRLDDVLQEVEIMKKCLEELAQRFGQDGKGSMSPRSFRLQAQGSGQIPNSIATSAENSYVPVATSSWAAPRVVVSPVASPAPPSREVLTAQVHRQMTGPVQPTSPQSMNRIVRSRSVPMVRPVEPGPVLGNSAVVKVATPSTVPGYVPNRNVRVVPAPQRPASPPPAPPMQRSTPPMDSPYVRYRAVRLPGSSVLTSQRRR